MQSIQVHVLPIVIIILVLLVSIRFLVFDVSRLLILAAWRARLRSLRGGVHASALENAGQPLVFPIPAHISADQACRL